MLAVDNTSKEWNSQQNSSFVLVSYLFMKIKRAVFTAGEGLFFSPSLCYLMPSPLWKQQIYAWSWTGKKLDSVACGFFAMKSSRTWWEVSSKSNQRIFNNVSVLTGGLQAARGNQEPGLSWVHPRMPKAVCVMKGSEWGKDCQLFAYILWTQWARVRDLQSEPRGEDFFTVQLCNVSWG